MEPSSNSVSDVLEWIYSWIPRGGRLEAQASSPTLSRDFWMPDRSCRFCFDCESEFGVFNRRHHCRRCGKVFCGKCSLNTIPASVEEGAPDEEGERVRVCNYCYQCRHPEEDSFPAIEENPSVLTPSLSAQSVSSSALRASASVVPLSPQQGVSGGPPGDRLPHVWDEALDESEQTHAMRTHQGGSRVLGSMSRRAMDQPPSPYRYRSDDDDDEFERQMEEEDDEEGLPIARELEDQPEDYEDESSSELAQDPRDSEGKTESSIYSTQSSIGHNPQSDDGSDSVRRGESVDGKGSSESTEDPENSFPWRRDSKEGELPSDGEEIPRKENPPLNFEKNPLIWIPPPPGDDQDDDDDDDIGTTPVEYDDDDEGGGAEWDVPKSPGSVGSEDIKKEKTVSDEHKKAMRAQVHMHFENLVAQLLVQKGIDVGEPANPESWLEIVTSLSWLAASLVKPDTSNGGGMDPGTYVKVKCVASGRPSESSVVKGIVFRKNVAHKRMTSRYKNPRLLLLAGALEYQRVSNQLSSLETLLNQENEHLKMTVARIEAHRPNVLLVEKSVSRYAQDILLNKEISLVLNVKRPLLDRIARCVGGQVVSSPDNLVTPKAVYCELFHVEKFVEEHGSAGGGKQLTKFLMFFEGCPKPLGCTILLKGANGDFLKKVKEVVQLAVFSAYHLQLETSFLEDEGATLPGLSCRPTGNVSILNRHTSYERSISTATGVSITESSQGPHIRSGLSSTVSISPFPSRTNSIGASAALSHLDTGSTATNAVPCSASSSCGSSATNSPGTSPAQSSFGYPSGISRSSSIGGTSTTTYHHASNGVYPGGQSWKGVSGLSVSLKRGVQDCNFDGDSNLEVSPSSGANGGLAFEVKALEVNTVRGPSSSTNSEQIVTTTASMVSKGTIRESGRNYQIEPEQVHAHLHVLIQNDPTYRQSDVERSKEDFPPSPSDRQSILVQFSKRCLAKGTVVKQPNFVRIKYYGNCDEPNGDKPLGMFLRDTLFDTTRPCDMCDESGDKHVLSYTHRQGSLTITVNKNTKNPLSGEKSGRIWMWHRCLRCALENGVPPATHRVIMSDAAWGLSFGKFLELSFSTHPAASRLAACGHSLHRDCLRFYGFGSVVACFRYSEITIHSFYLPPLKVEFNSPKQQGWLEKEKEEVDKQAHEVFDKVVNKVQVLGGKIKSARALCGNSATLDAQRRIVALETLLQNEKAVLEESRSRSDLDILKLNRLRRDLLISSLQWDWRLEYLESKSLPTHRRNTGSVGDPSMLSSKELDISNDSFKASESSEAEKESSSPDCDTESSFAGSSPSEQPSLADKPTETQLTGMEEVSTSMNESNGSDPLDPAPTAPTELADGNGLDFRQLTDEDSIPVEELLDNIDLDPSRGSISSSKSMVEDSTSALEGSTCLLEADGETGSTEAVGGEGAASLEVPDSAMKRMSPPRFLEGEVTARRALSEGSYPLLADLSDTLDAAWTGDAGSGDGPGVDESPEKVVDIVEANEEPPASESQDCVHEETSTDQPSAEARAKEDVSSNDASDGQVSGPSSPVMLDSSEDLSDLTQGWMGDPLANFFKSYSRASSILSTSSDAKVPPPLLPSKIPPAAQMDADGNARRVLLPQGHDDVVVAVYDEEPTTMIAYALSTEEHYVHVTDILVEKEKAKDKDQDRDSGDLSSEQALSHPLQFADVTGEVDVAVRENFGSNAALNSKIESEIENPLISTKASQMVKKTISFCEETPSGKVKFQVTCYFAKQFDALRKKCCMGSTEYVRSLSRCKKWGAQGGKSNVFFAKTADDRFVVKQVTKTELTSFLDFASSYFKYLFEALMNGNPTCLAKIFGVYEVKVTKGGKETKMDVLVMENLLYGRHITRVYDLKGSVRSRYNAEADSETGKSQVKLDQNLVEELPTNPIYVGKNAKRLLERAIWNDTHFLSLVFVMDYSLLVGVDVERKELVVGIIDFIRQYTWDKHLETWVKASGFLGGPKNAPPTVISPKQYKKRFRKAMSTYFLMVPDKWIPPPQLTISQNVSALEDGFINIVTKGDDGHDDPIPRIPN
ncbi:unnamed protein product [Calypogeia fissa]